MQYEKRAENPEPRPGEPVVLLQAMKEDSPRGGDFPASEIPAGTLMALVFRKTSYVSGVDDPGKVCYLVETSGDVNKTRRLGVTPEQLLDDELFYLPCLHMDSYGKEAYINTLTRDHYLPRQGDGMAGRAKALKEWRDDQFACRYELRSKSSVLGVYLSPRDARIAAAAVRAAVPAKELQLYRYDGAEFQPVNLEPASVGKA